MLCVPIVTWSFHSEATSAQIPSGDNQALRRKRSPVSSSNNDNNEDPEALSAEWQRGDMIILDVHFNTLQYVQMEQVTCLMCNRNMPNCLNECSTILVAIDDIQHIHWQHWRANRTVVGRKHYILCEICGDHGLTVLLQVLNLRLPTISFAL